MTACAEAFWAAGRSGRGDQEQERGDQSFHKFHLSAPFSSYAASAR
jgi:hypothetical protein